MDLFGYWKYYSDAQNSMYKTSCALAFEQLEQREATIANLARREDFLERQSQVTEKLNRILGPMAGKDTFKCQNSRGN